MKYFRSLFLLLCCLAVQLVFSARIEAQGVTIPPSKRVTINMGQMPWKFLVGQDPNGAQDPMFDDSSWQLVGLPHSADQLDTFINETSGGGAGDLTGDTVWYRRRFPMDPQFANSKVQVVFEGVHTGVQVYINGYFVPGTQSFAKQATHVVGFLPFVVDLTPHLNFGGDNVIAVRVSRNADWFPNPGFSQAFRFGQSDNGIFRSVYMHVTDKIHIPENIYSGSNTWGTYVATQSASDDSASIRVQTNILNEGSAAQDVTLTTEIVDANGNIVVTRQDEQTVTPSSAANPQPVLFDQTLAVERPNLWYPNNSLYGKPYLYKVFHIVSVNGVVVDSKQSPLGIRTVTWDKDFVYINGKLQKLWGASGRYDYPGLGTSVPEEQKWRDLQQLAAMGGNLWRPGHSAEGEAFLNAADALGIMVMQPSGDGENGFSDPCGPTAKMTCEQEQLKLDLHRDMIVAFRNHPSVLAWEADNGVTLPAFAQQLAILGKQWDYLGNDGPVDGPRGGRPQSDRSGGSQYAGNGDFMSCSGQGCEIGVKQGIPEKPAWGAEYWGPGVIRQDHDHEISMAAQYIDSWSKGIAAHTFGLSQWYFADSPGEVGIYTDVPHTPADEANERSIGDSMVDFERFPRLLYYVEGANWTPFSVKPVVKLAHTWNRFGNIQVNAWSNCPAVRLLVNNKAQGSDQVPNPFSSRADNDQDFVATELTSKLPGQVHWNLMWESGTATAACIDASGLPVKDASGNLVADTLTTAGPADHIVLENVPDVVRPDGTAFQVTANASDAAFVVAKVVDASGVVVPDASNLLTFSVSGPGTYVGGTQQMVTPGMPHTYHSPGDPELAAEGGLQKIAIKSQFTPGVVTVTATSPGLQGASTSFNINPIPQTTQTATAPLIVAQPVDTSVTQGFSAHFSVAVSGADPLTFQWFRNNSPLLNTNSATLDTALSTTEDDNAAYAVEISNNLGSVRSKDARLTVVAPAAPVVTLQPVSQTVDAGSTATFTVKASGSPTRQYQWSRGGVDIPGAIAETYTTQVVTAADNGSTYAVMVKNPVDSVRSDAAILTVNPAVAPVIATQPINVAALPGQPATFVAVVTGSNPIAYVWRHDDVIVGTSSPTLAISSVSNSDLGDYILTATNIAGSVTSNKVTLALAPPGVNMSLGKTGLGSSFEDPVGLASKFAIDGDEKTRWGSKFEDPQSYQIDFGVPMTFNRAVIAWDASFAQQYTLQVSDNGQEWVDIPNLPSSIGSGGHEDYTFPSQHARYLRMYGTQRNDLYGYSIHEFEIYNSPSVGGSNERWTINQDNTTLVTDNLSGLLWTRKQKTDNTAGAQFTQDSANDYCQSLGMRIPTLAEAAAISGTSASSAAFPAFWSTWTSTEDPEDATRAYNVDSTGSQFFGIKTNSPGATLCVLGDTQIAPVITQQPLPVTAKGNATATFTVAATATSGSGSATYTWLKDNVPFQINGIPSVTTPLLTAQDDGALYSVVVTGANGLTVTSTTALLTVSGVADPPPNNPGNPGNPGDPGNPGNPVPPPATGPAPVGPNFALQGTASESSSENDGYLGADKVNDGDLGTRWSSQPSDPQWIQIDLGSPKMIGEVQLVWETAYATQYQVQIPDGNGGWRPVDNPQGMTFLGGTENVVFAPVTTQLIRVLGTQRHTQYGYSLFEFGVYGPVLPVIQAQPVNQSVMSGNQAQFTVVAGGLGPFTYRWFRNNTVLAGANAATYNTPTLTSADSGTGFIVEVTNPYGHVTSNAAIVTVTEPVAGAANLARGKPAMSSADENAGLGAQLAVDGDLTTRWSSEFKDDAWFQVDLGQNMIVNKAVLRWEASYGKSYILQYSTDGSSWQNAVTQPNGAGGQETLNFPTVLARYVRMQGVARAMQYGYSLYEFELYGADVPSIASQPVNQTAAAGSTATFSVAATGSGTVGYQWLRNGAAIPGATSATYTTPSLQSQDSNSVFSVAVSNGNGTTVSDKATLTVNAPAPTGTNLALNGQTKSSGDENGNLLSGNAVDGSVTTRWSSNAADDAWIQVDLGSPKNIAEVQLNWENAYGSAYLVQVSNDQAQWSTVYTQGAGTGGVENIVFSPVTAEFVRMKGVKRGTPYGYSLFEFGVYGASTGSGNSGTAPSITVQPVSQAANAGSTATFSVVAAGTGPLTYQWFLNGNIIPGAQTASYTTPTLTAGDNGEKFTVTVGNAVNTTTSLPAVLSINGAGPAYTIYPGFIGVDLNNNTKGRWTDDQVYVTVIGIDPVTSVPQPDGSVPTRFATVKPDGTVVDIDAADNTASNALPKNGKTYPNYSFTLAQAKNLLKLPPITSGRIFISMGQPVYLTAFGQRTGGGNTSYAGPNPLNGTDPNIDVPYDWYEFNYDGPGHTIFINTTQVDQFGLPLTLDVWGAKASFHQQTGIAESIAQLDQEYLNETPAEFHTAGINSLRILSPTKANFASNGPNSTYFDVYTASLWQKYSNTPLVMSFGGRTFSGTTSGSNTFTFVDTNPSAALAGNTYLVDLPSTQEILECDGALARGASAQQTQGKTAIQAQDINATQLQIEAHFCGTLNRHILDNNSSTWGNAATYYGTAPANYYSQFWHRHSIGGLAYGFAYDDQYDQSSTIHNDAPEHMAFGIGW